MHAHACSGFNATLNFVTVFSPAFLLQSAHKKLKADGSFFQKEKRERLSVKKINHGS